MKRFKNKRKVISLTLVSIAYALIVTPLIISNFQKQHTLHSKVEGAQTTRNAELIQSTESECIPDGTAGIGISYTNVSIKPVSVYVSDNTSSNSVDLGQIRPNETKIGTILTRKGELSNGTVTFTVTSPNSWQKLQKSADYLSISCN